MNLTSKIDLALFYTKPVNQKVYYEVMWTKYKEKWEGLRFIEFSKETELRKSGKFTTKSGAESFVKNLIRHIIGFTGWFEIIEYK